MKKPKAPKKVSYQLIDAHTEYGAAMYQRLTRLVKAHHEPLRNANIALAWCTSWKRDVDGFLTLGKCRRTSDLDRELADFDFIILLLKSFWNDPLVTDVQRDALMDHELCHASLKYDKAGEPEEDERGRTVYRTRKHDVEEFNAIIERYGLYKADLAKFFASLHHSAKEGFKPCDSCRDTPGWVEVDRSVKRCSCWHTWKARLADSAA